MASRALVIRKMGDPEIAGAIETALIPRQQSTAEVEMLRAELTKLKRNEAALGVRVVRDRDYFYCKMKEAQYYYGDNPSHSKPYKIVLGVIGLACEFVSGWYKYLSAWNRS